MTIEKSEFPITAAASVIADISAGIYRSPAGALKELVSNAFDAEAKRVQISTNSPHFSTFTCSDDGVGIAPERFKEIMSLIGGSSKRDQGERSPNLGRPLIGRIGIGILSIGQICTRFEVYSSVQGSPIKFKATIDLQPYMRPEARRIKLHQQLAEGKTVPVGTCQMEIAPEEADKHYTRVVMENINPGFRRQLQSEPLTESGMTPKKFKKGDMRAFLDSVSRNTVSEHGAYAQLIWEMAATSPIKYLDGGPITNTPQLDDLRNRMVEFDFHLFVDGVQLYKPILLPPSKDVAFKVYPHLDFNETLSDGRKLRIRGYIYWQNRRILPREAQGILVRVRNVGIGAFDPTYLGYPRHEGWKFSQMTGEIYVDEGLDEAINIDRASFRETDEAYLRLQDFLFQRLGKETDEGAGIFSSIKELSKQSAERKKGKERRARAARVATNVFGSRKSIRMEISKDEPRASSSGVAVSSHAVIIDKDLGSRVPKRQQDLFIAICGVIERSLKTRVPANIRKEILSNIAAIFELA